MKALRLTYEGDLKQAEHLMDDAKQELARLEARLETTGLDFGKFLLGVPYSNGYAFGYVLPGGLRHIHVVASAGVEETFEFEPTELALPDFLSGYALDGRIDTDAETGIQAIRDFVPTAACASLHSDEVSPGHNRVERLAIDVGPGFSDYFPDRGPWPRSQVDKLYPTAYSGTMREWVQIMLGFGKKLVTTSVYDDVEPIVDEDKSISTKWESTLASDGMRVWYDFRFQRTHGITWAGDGKPWLVEISMNRGIVAMPLPLDDRTTTPEFREKLVTIGDQAGLDVVDKFGGFPSGEPFPSTAALWDAYKRAGRIIELAPPSQVSGFYSGLHYSSAMGWAFNKRGDEAHNTCYQYGDDGVQVGYHYACQMQIGATTEPPAVEEAAELRAALDSMRATKADIFDAVMWKTDRFTKQQCDAYLLRLNDEPTSAVFDEIDAIEMSPLAPGSASCTIAGQGKLWWPSKFQPQIKFFEPQLGYLLSHDLRPDNVQAPQPSFCDTTVHVFFAENELKWVKFYHDPRKTTGGWSGDDEFVFYNQAQGSFYREYTTSGYGVSTQFYSNDVDAREERPDSVNRYWMTGTPQGYPLYIFIIDHYGTPPANFGNGDLYWCRHKAFLKEQKWTMGVYRDTRCAACVPAWFRECVIMAEQEIDYDYGGYEGWYIQGVVDPNYGLEYIGDGDRAVDVNAYAGLQNVDPVYALNYGFADEGLWCAPGDQVVFSGDANYGSPVNSDLWPIPVSERSTFRATLIANSVHSPRVVELETRTKDVTIWDPLYFIPSPHPDFGDTQYHHATANSAGGAESLIYLETINGQKNVVVGSPQDSAFETRLPIFVGVVNG